MTRANIITLWNICFWLISIRLWLEWLYVRSAWSLLLAMMWDFLDWHVARYFKQESNIWKQLDSLADFLCFWIAPVCILYGFLWQEITFLFWIVSLWFVCCSARRLGRYNVSIEQNNKKVEYFEWIPTTANAIRVSIILFFSMHNEFVIIACMACMWGCMIATFKVKKPDISRIIKKT